MYNRPDLETASRGGAVLAHHPMYHECRILGEYRMYADPEDESVTPHLTREGFWESWVSVWMLNTLTPAHCVIDVGANQGYYAVIAAARWQQPVLAFEPQPRLAAMLNATATVFQYPITVVCGAVSDTDGDTTLYIPSRLKGGASIAGDPRHQGEISQALRVPLTTLDAYATWMDGHPLLVKIDAEGAEEAIWRGMQTLWETRDVTVLLEWEWSRYPDPMAFATALLTTARVTLVDYSGAEVPITHPDQLQTPDWITIVLRRNA